MVNGLVAMLRFTERELVLFATFWFVVAAIDELGIDLVWLWLCLTGRARDRQLPKGYERRPLSGRLAVMVPAWREADVIGEMIAHTLRAWPQRGLTLYIGCYRNDPDTVAAAMGAASGDPRLRLIIHDRDGPTTKADCLNRLYRAMVADEQRLGVPCTGVLMHDSEDMVHPCALAAIDRALEDVEFVQLPVRPEPHPSSPWVAGHYCEEFAEAHAKTMVVRSALGAAIPSAGVGCGFARATLARIAEWRLAETTRSARARGQAGLDQAGDEAETLAQAGPFAEDCLTEDYELGLLIARTGARTRFLRARDVHGALIATRAFFPATLGESVRQKTRWVHGIALQGWERLGWGSRLIDVWMVLRDRSGPLAALVLAAAYAVLIIDTLLIGARRLGLAAHLDRPPLVKVLIAICFANLVWRALWRFGFTAHEYGPAEGLRALARIPVSNVIAMMAARRALFAYVRTLRGAKIEWDKTRHSHLPAAARQPEVLAR